MESTTTAPGVRFTAQGRVASHTPGRLRVRIKRDRQQPEQLQTVKRALEHHLGHGGVQVSDTTHSVLVQYDRHAHSSSDMMSLLRDVGVIVTETARALGEDVPDLAGGHSTTSASIVNALSDLDQRISRWTGRQVDLKLLFPLTLGGIGAVQLARRGLGLSEVPAYVLLWYAFDSFWKFHHQSSGDTES
jgi:hypothetical protein